MIIDDVDRLHGDEFMTLMRAIRLLGRFSNVHYLLGYDQDTVLDLIQTSGMSTDRNRTHAFIEKIVQYPIMIPPIQEAHAWKLLGDGFEDILANQGLDFDPLDRGDFFRVFDRGMRYELNTVRAIYRFLNQFEIYLKLIGPGEINPLDLALLTYLRMHFPALYDHLYGWRTDSLEHKNSQR